MKKEMRYLLPNNDGLNLERSYINNFLRQMYKHIGKYDSSRLMKMLLFEVENGSMWDYNTALKLFKEAEAVNNMQYHSYFR